MYDLAVMLTISTSKVHLLIQSSINKSGPALTHSCYEKSILEQIKLLLACKTLSQSSTGWGTKKTKKTASAI